MAKQKSQTSGPDEFMFPIVEGLLNDGTRKLINARDVHQRLRVGRAFPHWIKELIQKHGLVPGKDYVVVPHFPTPNQVLPMGLDYHLHPAVAMNVACEQRYRRGRVAKDETATLQRLAWLECAHDLMVEDLLRRQPEMKRMLSLRFNPQLNDQQRAEAMGMESVEAWTRGINTLTTYGVLHWFSDRVEEQSQDTGLNVSLV